MHRLVLFLAAGLAACSSTEPDLDSITLVADHTSYVAPATIKVTLTNASSETVKTGICAGLQRHDGDVWSDLPQTEPCPSVLRLLESGTSMSVGILVAEGFVPGEYRAVMGVSGPVPVPEIPSQPFSVK